MGAVQIVVVAVPVIIHRDAVDGDSGRHICDALDAVCECCEEELKKADPDGDLPILPNIFPAIRKRLRAALDSS